jgi:hypothetical protein
VTGKGTGVLMRQAIVDLYESARDMCKRLFLQAYRDRLPVKIQDHYAKLHRELNYVAELRTGIHNLRGSERLTTEDIDDWDERMFGEQRDELGEDIEEALKLACVAAGGDARMAQYVTDRLRTT